MQFLDKIFCQAWFRFVNSPIDTTEMVGCFYNIIYICIFCWDRVWAGFLRYNWNYRLNQFEYDRIFPPLSFISFCSFRILSRGLSLKLLIFFFLDHSASSGIFLVLPVRKASGILLQAIVTCRTLGYSIFFANSLTEICFIKWDCLTIAIGKISLFWFVKILLFCR